jgi:hypothetical protein
MHCLGHFSPHPVPFPHPHFQADPILPLSLILLKKRHKHNKEDKAFLKKTKTKSVAENLCQNKFRASVNQHKITNEQIVKM